MTAIPNEQWEQLRAKIAAVLEDQRLNGQQQLDALLSAVQPLVMSGHALIDPERGTSTLTWRQLRDRERGELSELRAWGLLVNNLDRCEHGRHEGDVCSGCNGPSKGNPVYDHTGDVDDTLTNGEWRLLARYNDEAWPDRLIGFGMDGVPICVPPRPEPGSAALKPDAYYRRDLR
jgi:hypothetical protein